MPILKQIRTCLAVVALGFASGAMAEVVPVVSVKSPVNGMSQSQMIDIFLGKTSRFPNGDPAVPIDHLEGSEVRDAFYMKFASRSAAQIKAYWSKIIFTGRGQPPREVYPSEKVKKVLAENPYSIGYIDSNELDDNVKVVSLTR